MREAKASFSPVESREMTAKVFISDPVGGEGHDRTNGNAASTGARPSMIDHGSPAP